MESFLWRLAVFGLLSSCIHAQYYPGDDHDISFDGYPFHRSYPRSFDRRSRPYRPYSRRNHRKFHTGNRGSRDCDSCKEIEGSCTWAAPEDQVKCAKPKVIYTGSQCLQARIKCECAGHYNVRLETDSGHVLAIGKEKEIVAKCQNGKWMAKDSRNKKISFNRLRCIPTDRREVIRPCNQSLDMGDKPCDEDATIRYHFDAETRNCLAFKYTGCGGNANNFNSESDCYLECLPADYFDCPANSPPTLRPDGSADCDREERKCPEGSYCEYGMESGICCDSKIREKYKANIRPDCGDRKIVLEGDSAGRRRMLRTLARVLTHASSGEARPRLRYVNCRMTHNHVLTLLYNKSHS